MPDRKKYIKVLSKTVKTVKEYNEDAPIKISLKCVEDILEMLKEQEDLGTELTNAVELIHKKNERIKKLMKEQEAIVRCKDCKSSFEKNGAFFCKTLLSDRIALVDKEWFCADGERRVEWNDSGDEAEAAGENEDYHSDGGRVSGSGDADRIRGD